MDGSLYSALLRTGAEREKEKEKKKKEKELLLLFPMTSLELVSEVTSHSFLCVPFV